MVGLLADSTVWIDLLNNRKSKSVEFLKSKIIAGERVVICPVVIQEVLQGIRDDKLHDVVKDHLLSFEILLLDALDAAL